MEAFKSNVSEIINRENVHLLVRGRSQYTYKYKSEWIFFFKIILNIIKNTIKI